MDWKLEQRIRERAFEIWLQEGKPEGRSEEHWAQAEREITGGHNSNPFESEGSLVDKGEGQAPGEVYEW